MITGEISSLRFDATFRVC